MLYLRDKKIEQNNDSNNNNQKDQGENGIAGVKLILWKDKDGDGKPEYTGFMGGTETDQNGNYNFKNLEPGIYQVFVWEMENFEQHIHSVGLYNSKKKQ